MDSLVMNHLVRRGFEAHQSGNLSQGTKNQVSILAVVYLIVVFILFVGSMAVISYTFGQIIATLSMVESPSATLYVPVPNNNAPESLDASVEDAKPETVDPELIVIKEAPITSSIFKASKHLAAQAGPNGRFRGVCFRGISIVLVKNLIEWGLAKLFISTLPNFFGTIPITIVLSEVALANFSLAWTHLVITTPSSKSWFQQMSFRSWRKITRPTLILAVAKQIAFMAPVYLVEVWGLQGAPKDSHFTQKVMFVSLLSLATMFLVVIPAKVTLTRVQASLLSEDQETVVPFDRSFGGKVVPEVVGGSGMIGLLDAWKTFDFNSRIRLIKLYAKVLAMQIFVVVLSFVAVGGLFAKMGPQLIST